MLINLIKKCNVKLFFNFFYKLTFNVISLVQQGASQLMKKIIKHK